MCGIIGHIANIDSKPDVSGVKSGIDKLYNRGPDDNGIYTDNHACLGHTRLSIIDTSVNTQPRISDCKRYVISFNGEIYNFNELRTILIKRNVIFKSKGDTEVLLNMYIEFGASCLEMLNGMFAFAIWDNVERRLIIARDRMGEKPLYYSKNSNGLFFSSELNALLSFKSIDRDISNDSLNDFFSFQFITNNNSIYKNIQQLPQASYLIFENGNITQQRKYWSLPNEAPRSTPSGDLVDELDELLNDSIKLRLVSDVPIGSFLSGGLDSSLITAIASRYKSNIDTFTIGFSNSTYDESSHAEMASRLLKTNHHSKNINIDIIDALESTVKYSGEPFSDPSNIPTHLLSMHTKKNVKVALSGDGADELFGGYNRYKAAYYFSLLRKIPLKNTQCFFIKKCLNYISSSNNYYADSYSKSFELFLRFVLRGITSPSEFSPRTFLLPELNSLLDASESEARMINEESMYKLYDHSYVNKYMQTDINNYLPGDILVKVDRMSMLNSLEVRSPFLDHRIVEFSNRLSLSEKLNLFNKKIILKKLGKKYLNDDILNRKKHGFSSPVGIWLKNELYDYFNDVVLCNTSHNYYNINEVKKLWLEHNSGSKDHGFKLWSILVFNIWYKFNHLNYS